MIAGNKLLNYCIVLRQNSSTKFVVYFPSSSRSLKTWSNVQLAPPDAIFGLVEAFKKDTFPQKANLAVGAYRTNEGKPFLLPSVLKAEEIISKKKLDKEYLPITGNAQFCDLAAKFVFGEDSDIIKKNLNLTIQSLSGTGALFIAGMFLKRFYPGAKVVYIPDPTWPNHLKIFNLCGLETKTYRYYDRKVNWFNFDFLKEDICVSSHLFYFYNWVYIFFACPEQVLIHFCPHVIFEYILRRYFRERL